jgi:hypothetical protein
MTNNTDYYSSSYILLINNSQMTMQAMSQQYEDTSKDSDSSDGYTDVDGSTPGVVKYFDLPPGTTEDSYSQEPLQQPIKMLY